MDRALADLDFTLPQFAVMTMLNVYLGVSSADIARLELLTPKKVSVIIANLERAGAIERIPHDVHGWILPIELTPDGRALLRRCRERVQKLQHELSFGLDMKEEAAIRHGWCEWRSREREGLFDDEACPITMMNWVDGA